MKTLLIASALFAGLFGCFSAPPAPYQPFCKSLWFIDVSCAEISVKLVEQIEAFNPVNGCDDCLYTLISASPLSIKANHTSADGLQTENISFTLKPAVLTPSCRVAGQSVSLSSYSLLDDGLNYCNLMNLLTASGLTSAPGFIEVTNEWACLGQGLSTCNAVKSGVKLSSVAPLKQPLL